MQEEQTKKKRITDKGVALAKAEHHCAYQERSQQEVRSKLYDWGIWTDAVEEIISELIINNFLNEERFAKAYAQGKFRVKGWGRAKIKQGLKFKGISENCIKKGLAIIDPDEYEQKLAEIIKKKSALEKEKNELKRNYKLASYAISRGFESDMVWEKIKKFSI